MSSHNTLPQAPLWVHWFAAFILGTTVTAYGVTHQPTRLDSRLSHSAAQEHASVAQWNRHLAARIQALFYSGECSALVSGQQALTPTDRLEIYNPENGGHQTLSPAAQGILGRFWTGDIHTLDDLSADIALNRQALTDGEIDYILSVTSAPRSLQATGFHYNVSRPGAKRHSAENEQTTNLLNNRIQPSASKDGEQL